MRSLRQITVRGGDVHGSFFGTDCYLFSFFFMLLRAGCRVGSWGGRRAGTDRSFKVQAPQYLQFTRHSDVWRPYLQVQRYYHRNKDVRQRSRNA